ncbi:MAG: 50S ribosomal protein L17 [Spirochaetes bacterium]|nr:50S ribosomal protein L17 [Spirochaetota bacterium]
MRHKNSVRQLGKTPSHRGAMFSNMVASLYLNESIITTKQKAKELKKISEKLITKARKNISLPENEVGKKLHNKRSVLKFVKDEDAVKKLFDEIAPRYANRNGGYTRIYLLGKRLGDAAEMAIIELVDKKVAVKRETEKDKAVKDKTAKETIIKDKKDKSEKKDKKVKKDKKE